MMTVRAMSHLELRNSRNVRNCLWVGGKEGRVAGTAKLFRKYEQVFIKKQENMIDIIDNLRRIRLLFL